MFGKSGRPRIWAGALAATLALTPLAACGESVDTTAVQLKKCGTTTVTTGKKPHERQVQRAVWVYTITNKSKQYTQVYGIDTDQPNHIGDSLPVEPGESSEFKFVSADYTSYTATVTDNNDAQVLRVTISGTCPTTP